MSGEIGASLVFGLLSAFIVYIGWRRGFFIFPNTSWEVPVRIAHVIAVFAIYFFVTYASSYFFLYLSQQKILPDTVSLTSWFNFTTSLAIAACLALLLFILPKKIRSGIWHRSSSEPKKPVTEDLWFALFAWAISFPLVLFLSQMLELLVSAIFHISQLPDQVAVRYLKMTFEHPFYLLMSVGSIVFLAPLIEETLFRGFLQTFIRQHLGSKHAILITSLCFSFFHYSSEQGLGNIPIIGSLFILALFLGYLYERQGSLIAPMALHATFNAISVMNIYFLGGFAGGI